MTSYLARSRRAAFVGCAALGMLVASACQSGVTDTLLEATDPDLVNPSNLESPDGADAVRIGALYRFSQSTAGAETIWLFGGQLADEFTSTTTFVQNDEADTRQVKDDNTTMLPMFRNLNRTRTGANQAIASLKKYRPTQTANIAEMYFARGYSEMQLAQDFCNGIPLSDASGGTLVYGSPLSGKEVFERALASFDSALANATGSDAFSVLMANASKVGRARALLNLNRHAEVAAAVAGVPTSFSYNHTYLQVSGDNQMWSWTNSTFRYSLGDSVEGNGRTFLVKNALPFFSAKDSRITGSYTIRTVNNRPDTLKAQDGQTYFRGNNLYASREAPVVVASGVDARLAEAEVRLKANDVAGMMTILNALRAAPQNLGGLTSTALPALTAPATQDAATSLFFREKAFWTFGRGQRLGDLRRLMRQYNRTQDQVFPTGAFFKGGSYGTDVNLPIPQAELNNPNSKGCTDRLP
jgi:hypothetical protein